MKDLWGWSYVGQPGPEYPLAPTEPPVEDKHPVEGEYVEIPPQLNSINMKQELIKLLESVGSWVLVRKYDKSVRCSCLRRTGGRPDPTCVICEGKAHPYFEYPIKGYMTSAAAYGSMPIGDSVIRFGTFAEEGMTFFTPVSSNLALSDQVFEVRLTPSQHIQMPIDRLCRYVISRVSLLRADRLGDIDYLLVNLQEHESKL